MKRLVVLLVLVSSLHVEPQEWPLRIWPVKYWEVPGMCVGYSRDISGEETPFEYRCDQQDLLDTAKTQQWHWLGRKDYPFNL